MEARAFGELGQDVPESVHGAAAAVGIGPELLDRPDEPRCPVADHEQWTPETPSDEAPPEIEPVLGPLPLTKADIEQDPLALGR